MEKLSITSGKLVKPSWGDKMRLIVGALFVLLSVGPGTAQSKVGEGNALLRGVGAESCGKYLSAIHGNAPGKAKTVTRPEAEYFEKAWLYTEWMMGYITALNVLYDSNSQVLTDVAALDVWVRKWCDTNPTQNVYSAVNAFVGSGGERKLRQF